MNHKIMDEQKKKVLDFLASHSLGVISTVDEDGRPEAAVVGFAELPDLTLIFGTFLQYRKYKNIKKNPHVALVIGWESATVQYEGVARELDGHEREEAKKMIVAKNPHSEKFIELPEECYFRITPTWVRYTDYADDSIYGNVFEIRF